MIYFKGDQNFVERTTVISDAVPLRVERSKVGGGGVQDVVLDLGVRGLGQVLHKL